jgi:small GTP-binding protein
MRYNVVFVGSVGAGKTSVITKYCKGTPGTETTSTIAVDYVPLTLGDVQVSVWDTCGQERFLSLTKSYFMRGHVFVLVHDIASSTIGDDLKKWYQCIVREKPARHTPVVIVVSNKTDLAPFCDSAIVNWVGEHNFDHLYTSAVSGEGIAQLFAQIKNAVVVHQSEWLAPSLPTLSATTELRTAPGCMC